MPELAAEYCFQYGGNLKDGIKGQGQYCHFKEDGFTYTYDQAQATCENIFGTLPIIKSLEAHTIFQNDDCSLLDIDIPGQSECPGVSKIETKHL